MLCMELFHKVVGVSFVAVPLSLGWLVNALWLGRRQERLALRQGGEPLAA
jgi:hypothetical protein